jgi:DNA invertase Pin-like site-specific DNA recombinase
MDAAVYLRISSDPEKKQLGVTRQREDCEKLCADKGWHPVEYLDNDTSASSGKKRPAYERMVADIRDGRLGAVVCWDLDRLHRRPIELESFMALADEKRLALATVSGDVDLSTAQGRLIARLKGSVAAHEIEHKRARQLRAAQQKAEQGRPQWKYAYGYIGDTHKPDPKVAKLLTKVCRLILSGGSLQDACNILNAAGSHRQWVRRPVDPVTGERGMKIELREWTPASLGLLLDKPYLAGLREHNGEIVGSGTWEPLLDPELWRSVKDKRLQRNATRRTIRRHLLSGALNCGNCNEWHLTAQYTSKGTVQYNCRNCFKCGIAEHHMKPIVLGAVGGRLAMPDAVDLLRGQEHDTTEAEDTRQKIATLNARLDELAVERGMGLLTARQLQIASEVVQRELDKIEAERRDRDKVRVFDGIRLGTPLAVKDIEKLSPGRLRAVIDVLMTVTIAPAVKQGSNIFYPDRVQIAWK